MPIPAGVTVDSVDTTTGSFSSSKPAISAGAVTVTFIGPTSTTGLQIPKITLHSTVANDAPATIVWPSYAKFVAKTTLFPDPVTCVPDPGAPPLAKIAVTGGKPGSSSPTTPAPGGASPKFTG